jgi:hypothetical protein
MNVQHFGTRRASSQSTSPKDSLINALINTSCATELGAPMIANSQHRLEATLNKLEMELRERVGKKANLRLYVREGIAMIEGRLPTFYLKQIVLNALARGLPLDVDAKGLVVE